MCSTVVIGGGPAGLMATYALIKRNKEVILIEKNEKLGKKLYITGKGRCNVSNASFGNEFLKNVVSNPKFLFASLANFSSNDTVDFFIKNGLKIKTERGNRIFPESDKASDVTKVFENFFSKNNIDIRLNTKVIGIKVSNGQVTGVQTVSGDIDCDSVIVATGGISYPLTGSTGDGYMFAKKLGHTVIPPKSALVGIETKDVFSELQGLTLKNVLLCAESGGKKLFGEMGEMLFTHYGISGPLVLSCSSYINRLDLSGVNMYIDLKPALDKSVLNQRLLKEFSNNNLKTVATMLSNMMPRSLVVPFLKIASVNANRNCSEITSEERRKIIDVFKHFPIQIKSLRPIDEAIVTSGGINVKEVNPKTMESKLIKGLFFAGEVLDVDALTGGFNIQIALSTGNLAGMNA